VQLLLDHMDPRFGNGGFGRPGGFGHHGWVWFGLLPLIFWAVLIAVAIWGILRLTSHRPVPAMAGAAPVPPRPRPDGALEEVRLRYARGEMSREEFVQRTRDLGGAEPGPDPSTGPVGSVGPVDPPASDES
jgi:putative membrane protein